MKVLVCSRKEHKIKTRIKIGQENVEEDFNYLGSQIMTEGNSLKDFKLCKESRLLIKRRRYHTQKL